MHNDCKLSIIDEELDKKNRICAKYNIYCDGTEDDIEKCPLWSISIQIDGLRNDLFDYIR